MKKKKENWNKEKREQINFKFVERRKREWIKKEKKKTNKERLRKYWKRI